MVNVLLSLIEKFHYLSNNSIILYDIKQENIVWGIFSQNKINNINDCYFIDFIDYGLGILLKNKCFESNKNNKKKIDIPLYMSISTHQNLMTNYF